MIQTECELYITAIMGRNMITLCEYVNNSSEHYNIVGKEIRMIHKWTLK